MQIKRFKDYLLDDDIDKLMTLKEKSKFHKWMSGQTVPGIVTDTGKTIFGYYPWDVSRFLKLIRNNEETYFD